MYEIFSRAAKVVIWLVPRSTTSSLAITYITTRGTHLDTAKAHSSLVDLLSLEYWRRMWIVQEALLARRLDLVYGEEVFHWDDLYATVAVHTGNKCLCPRKKSIMNFHQRLRETPGTIIVSARCK